MKILVVGAGIAGCTVAALLRKYNVGEVTVIEKTPELRDIGYLLAFWGTGRKILRELDIEAKIIDRGHEYELDIIMDQHGRVMKMIPSPIEKVGQTVVIRRADLHHGLFDLLAGTDVRFDTTITLMRQEDGKVYVELSDGTKEYFDLVVGADGIHSSVRERIFGTKFLRYYGWGAWIWWMPENYKFKKDPMGYYGGGRVCATAPFYGTSVAIAIGTVRPGTGKDPALRNTILKSLFADFCDDARAIIDTVSSAKHVYYDDIAEIQMPLWHRGRVVLIGDAQHAVSPVSGMGASMAMEDASVLVDELRHGKTVEGALDQFATRREKRIRHFRKLVNRADRWVMVGGILGYLRNRFLSYVPDWYFVRYLDKFLNAEV